MNPPTHSAHAQFKSYFDIGALRIVALAEPDWSREQEGDRVRYPRTNFARCPLPTAIEIKGVVRAGTLPEAFETGALTPARLRHDGENDAKRTNSRFLLAEPVTVEGRKGVQMEASADLNGTIYFITRWIGQGDRMLDVKVTARDLELARELSGTATRSLVPQVFGN